MNLRKSKEVDIFNNLNNSLTIDQQVINSGIPLFKVLSNNINKN